MNVLAREEVGLWIFIVVMNFFALSLFCLRFFSLPFSIREGMHLLFVHLWMYGRAAAAAAAVLGELSSCGAPLDLSSHVCVLLPCVCGNT